MLRFLAATALAFAPIFLANLVFAQRFKNVGSSTTAFGASLLGAIVGGVLEYLSLITGFRFLLVVVAVLYGLAFVFGRRHLAADTCAYGSTRDPPGTCAVRMRARCWEIPGRLTPVPGPSQPRRMPSSATWRCSWAARRRSARVGSRCPRVDPGGSGQGAVAVLVRPPRPVVRHCPPFWVTPVSPSDDLLQNYPLRVLAGSNSAAGTSRSTTPTSGAARRCSGMERGGRLSR